MSRVSLILIVLLLLLLAAGVGFFLVQSGDAEEKAPSHQSAAEPAESQPGHQVPEHSFADVDRWVRIFDDPARDEWQMPEQVVEALGVGPGAVVADLGAGTGYFTMHLARAVAPGGRVLAIDTEPNMVEYLGQRAEHEGVQGVEPILTEPDDPPLPPGAVDWVLLVDTYHHIHHRVRYFQALRRSLASGGRVVVIDDFKKPLPVGPPPENKMSRGDVVAEFEQAGYRLASEKTFLPYQYFLSFEPLPPKD